MPVISLAVASDVMRNKKALVDEGQEKFVTRHRHQWRVVFPTYRTRGAAAWKFKRAAIDVSA